MAAPAVILVPEELAAYHAGCPVVTLRRWATEGRIQRYPSPGRRNGVQYDVNSLPLAQRDEITREVIYRPPPPPLPHNRVKQAA